MLGSFEYGVPGPDYISDFEDATSLENIWGLVSASVLPPRQLWIAVLPYRVAESNFLYFPLCHSCAVSGNVETFCTHEDRFRTLTSTWCSEELRYAVTRGYKIMRIHHVWNWPPERRRKDLFSGYMKRMLALKIAASGFSAWTNTAEERQAYVEDCAAKNGVQLRIEDIIKNTGMRFLSKLCLNALLHKYCIYEEAYWPKTFTFSETFLRLATVERRKY